MKKKVLIGVAAVLVVGGIATGAGEEDAAEPAAPAAPEPSTAAPEPAPEPSAVATTSDEPDDFPSAAATEPEYPPFEGVDTYTSSYFIALEDTTLAETMGEERLYRLGVRTCERFDSGVSVDEEMRDLDAMGDDAGSMLGAAVGFLCPQHEEAAQEWVDANS